mmetsp:Transcript_62748/g.181895  ORF Transcript_62748/g.181895 Transcript_62748/m.181895 type:complete len:163 (-) Transcript_62748:126-614(-)
MSAEEEGDSPPAAIPLTQASLQQLNMVKQQLEQELKGLMNNLEALREAENRFKASTDTLASMVPENEGKNMLIPITSSLYIDGQMKHTTRVTVDVGTGYFIEMSADRAKKYCAKRVKMLSDNSMKVEKMLKEKRKSYEMVTQTMQVKYMKMQEAMEAQKSGT